jgi:hypothetical protein
MNQLLLTQSQSALDAWLRQLAPDVRQEGDHCWQLALKYGMLLRVSAPVDDTFLLFDAPALVSCELQQAPQWLRWNATLAGNAKLALVPLPWRSRLRAEVPIADDANAAARIAETLRGLHDACALLIGGVALAGEILPPRAASAADDAPRTSGTLLALLGEMAWPFQERADGVAAVEVAMRGGCRVLLEENAFGVRAAMELLRVDSLAPDSRLALAALLLSAGGTLRLARPYATEAEDKFVCGFEVRFAGETTAGELEHALEALAVACWACKQEVHSLLDNSVAESYLAIRNLTPTLAERSSTHG